MAIYNWPDDLRPSTMTMTLVSNTRALRSKWSGSVQTQETPGTRWQITMTFNNLSDDESRKLESLFVRLNGMAHRVRCRDFGRETFVAKGNPVVTAGSKMGSQLNTSGWTPGQVIMREGDYFVVNCEMKMATADITSGPTGQATLQFGPPLRRSPDAGAAIQTNNIWSVFLLNSNESGVDREPAFNNSITFTLEEDIV